jgi:hypothetical protein
MVGIVQQFDEEHETMNFPRPNNIKIEKVTDDIFEEEERIRSGRELRWSLAIYICKSQSKMELHMRICRSL